jgi:diguanylate cyclase (GGDEF)-like protein
MQILIVEDSAVSRVVLKRALAGIGHDCLEAADGETAWELFRQHRPDVVISDRTMPGLDGLGLCRLIREEAGSSYAYFILLTASSDREQMVAAMEAGADDYLVKPLDVVALRAGLIAAARVTSLHAQLSAQQAQLERLNGLLFADSRSDALTGLGNRLRLEEDLRALIARATRYEHRYAIAMCDVDFFKKYNDRYGHPAGDAALRGVANALSEGLRQGDMAYRYGGEEFVVVLAGQDLDGASIAMERLRKSVADLGMEHAGNTGGIVTISAGVSRLDPSAGDTLSDWLAAADRALYMAKEAGRNRVVIADPADAAA